MIDVQENEDGSICITWDEFDERESLMNDWGAEKFIEALTSGLLYVQKRYDEEGNSAPGLIVENPETLQRNGPEADGLTEDAKGD